MKELDPDNALANKTVLRLTPIVNERREKMKDEMLGEISKDLSRFNCKCNNLYVVWTTVSIILPARRH